MVIALLYSSGLRINEALSLRLQHLDFSRQVIHVYNGKGMKDRYTLLCPSLATTLKLQTQHALQIHRLDKGKRVGASMPPSLARKFPGAWAQPGLQFLFPSAALCHHPDTQQLCRHHQHDSVIRKHLKKR
ncbi:MAG: tyrosine-type recombinase/integrase [Endozoicomonas sp.]